MSYLRYLCLFAHSCVKHISHSVFDLFFFILCINLYMIYVTDRYLVHVNIKLYSDILIVFSTRERKNTGKKKHLDYYSKDSS
jgi:hypothetical protein